ncbi:DNA gyrase inhibitor YacG [Anaerohalosphaeraceae bacterium U12dextr]
MAFECPICKKPVCPPQNRQRGCFPFCSERCRLIDLGKWIDGVYRIPVQTAPDTHPAPSESADEME